MDVEAFIEAQKYPILQKWVMDKDGFQTRKTLRIVRTQQFQDWYKANPKGTFDQYLVFLQQRRLEYVNSPQYQIMILQNQLEDANREIDKLQENLDDKNEQIESLSESLNQYKIATFISLILLIACILFVKRAIIHRHFKRLSAKHI